MVRYIELRNSQRKITELSIAHSGVCYSLSGSSLMPVLVLTASVGRRLIARTRGVAAAYPGLRSPLGVWFGSQTFGWFSMLF